MSVTKQDIIYSAFKMFKEKGYLATSIQEIAQDCSIAKGSVYKYFPSKEDLLCEVFDQCQLAYFDQAERLKEIGTEALRSDLWTRSYFVFSILWNIVILWWISLIYRLRNTKLFAD